MKRGLRSWLSNGKRLLFWKRVKLFKKKLPFYDDEMVGTPQPPEGA